MPAYITVTATASSLKDKSPLFDIDYSLTKTTARHITTSTALPTIMTLPLAFSLGPWWYAYT